MPERWPLEPVLDHYYIHYRDTPNWQAILCPAHDETRRSCSLNLESAWLECHACGFKGGALDLIEAKEHVTREAAIALAEKATGISRGDIRVSPTGNTRRRLPQKQGFRPPVRRESPSRVRGRTGQWF